MTNDPLPTVVEEFAQRQPTVWQAYNQLGQAISEAGPLDEKTRRLIKLAIAVGSGREGAVKAHARRAQRAGIPYDELEHVALLGITTAGWPAAFASLCWIGQAVEDSKSD